MGDEEWLHPRSWQDQTAQGSGGHDVGDRRFAEDDRDLTEEFTSAKARSFRAIHHDRRLTVQDHVEAGSGEPLAEDSLPVAEGHLLELVDDALKLRIRQIREQREPGDRVYQLRSVDHDPMVPDAAVAGKALPAVDDPRSSGAAWPERRWRLWMTLTNDRKSAVLSAARLFDGVDSEGMDRIAAVAVEVDFPGDHVIARQGEIGTGFFVIVDGGARVVRDGTTIATVGPGDFFGELSVLDGRPRTAQVIANGPTTCLALATWDFEAILLAEPRVTLAILRGLATRLRDLTEAARH